MPTFREQKEAQSMEATNKPKRPLIEVVPDTYGRLQRLSRELDRSVGEIVTDLLDRYERDEFWHEVNESVNRLREDPVAWKDYKDEIALLEGGSMDGLEQEDPWFTPEEEEEIRAEAARSRNG
jgi:hypothetical protein